MTKIELEFFLKWMNKNLDSKPTYTYDVYGSKFDKDEKAPRAGLKIYDIYGSGVFTLWQDALLFISEPPKGAKSVLIDRTVDYILSETTSGIGNAMADFVGSVFNKKKEDFLNTISNDYSFFIPISSIDTIEGGKGFLGLFGQALDIYYKDFEGNEVHSYFWGNKVKPFPAYTVRKSIEKSRNNA